MATAQRQLVATSQPSASPGFNANAANAWLAGAGAISAIAGAVGQRATQKAKTFYERTALEMNRRLAELQAADAIRRGEREAQLTRLRVRGVIGSQRATLGAQGLDIGTGSALAVQEDAKAAGALDALTIRNNAWREALGYRLQAVSFGGQSEFAKFASETAQRQTLTTGGLKFAKGLGESALFFRKAKQDAEG